MKRILAILLIAATAFSFSACGGTTDNSESDTEPRTVVSSTADESSGTETDSAKPADNGKKVLVAYFSATGTTKKVAQYAAEAMSADIYEIVPAVPYTSADLNYNNDDCRANTEMNDPSCRPEISGGVEHMADYDIVFIGYPIWWGEVPRIVATFVESYDFSGKTVVTFCTSGSSSLNDRGIKELVSGANWITGTRLSGGASQSDVAAWINGLGLAIKAE